MHVHFGGKVKRKKERKTYKTDISVALCIGVAAAVPLHSDDPLSSSPSIPKRFIYFCLCHFLMQKNFVFLFFCRLSIEPLFRLYSDFIMKNVPKIKINIEPYELQCSLHLYAVCIKFRNETSIICMPCHFLPYFS